METIHSYKLGAVLEEVFYPIEKLSLDAEGLKLLEKYLVIDFVEGFGKIKIHHIMFVAFEYTMDHIVNVLQKVSKAASALSEAMLVFREEVVGFQVVDQ